MKTKTKIIILGGIGTAINIAEGIYDAGSRYGANIEMLGFAFDNEEFGASINGFPILCKTKEAFKKYEKFDDIKFIFQMNHQNKMRERAELVKSYRIPLQKWFTFIHPTAFISKSVKIGYGTVVYANCVIHSNAVIGNHCTFSALTTIGHDSVIGDHVFTATHVCIGSNVHMGNFLFLGQNVAVTNSVKIKDGNLIGLGTNVIKDISLADHVFIGSPAKPIKTIEGY